MKNTFITFSKACLLFAAVAAVASAVPINGSIAFTGTPTFNTTPISAATSFTAFTNEEVQTGQQTGSYAAIPNHAVVDFTPFTFVPPAGAVTPLWTLTVGGITYSFNATSMTSSYDATRTLWNIGGSGIAKMTGFTDTAGTWNLSAGNQGGSFFFGSAAVVPDNATTALLLGFALLGFGLIARRRAS